MKLLTAFTLIALIQHASIASFTMETVTVGALDNAADTTGYGAVSYEYAMGKYEVTNSQYVAFLNAKAADDTLSLFNASMSITQTGSSGEYVYSTTSPDAPILSLSFWSAVRFANWMHNGQGTGDTETGSYTLTSEGMANNTVTRNANATWVIPSEDEWYKAAYYNAELETYTMYAAGTGVLPEAATPNVDSDQANFNNVVGHATAVGAYTGSVSYWGTFDQNGNASEWLETIESASERTYRGGSYMTPGILLKKTARNGLGLEGNSDTGFRLAMVPEPQWSAALMAAAAFLYLCLGRRALQKR